MKHASAPAVRAPSCWRPNPRFPMTSGPMAVAHHIMSASTTGGPASQRHIPTKPPLPPPPAVQLGTGEMIHPPIVTTTTAPSAGERLGLPLPGGAALPSSRMEQLPIEALEMIFTRLESGRDLQAMASCSKKLRQMATADDFWQAAVTRRWHIHQVVNPRLLRDPDGFGWMRLYTNWERTLRLPTCPWTSQSSVIFARSLTARDSARSRRAKSREPGGYITTPVWPEQPSVGTTGGEVGALLWVVVNHAEDCQLRGGPDGSRYLELRVVVQNTRDRPAYIRPAACELHCQRASPLTVTQRERVTPSTVSLLPLPLTEEQESDGLARSSARLLALHTAADAQVAEAASREGESTAPLVSGTICLPKRWSFAVMGCLRFTVGCDALGMPTVEPEALERCRELRVPLLVADHSDGSGKGLRPAGEARARFDEERVWKHYRCAR